MPDAKTPWLFREERKERKLTEKLFDRFDECLRALNVELKSGQIVEATFVTVPIQRRNRDENALIGENIYGDKDHVNVDRDTKLITAWEDTPAQVHDSHVLEALLRSPEAGGAEIHADSAYRSAQQEARLEEAEYVSHIHEKGTRAPARVQIGLLNLIYNIKRVALLIRQRRWNFDRVLAPTAG